MKIKTCSPNKNVNKLVLLMNFERERERESQLFPTIRNSQLFQFLSFILFLTGLPLYLLWCYCFLNMHFLFIMEWIL